MRKVERTSTLYQYLLLLQEMLMLQHYGNIRGQMPNALDTIHNYYEHMVIEQFYEKHSDKLGNSEYVADIACVALNQLPTKYIRHDVDMAFFLSSDERAQMLREVEKAITEAIAYVDNNDKTYD